MQLYGLQQMTLLDFPGRVACTIFLNNCDLRCTYCHNAELIDSMAVPVMTDDELFSFLERRYHLLDGVCISGGEPCLHEELPSLLDHIRDMGFETKLDTNGFHPKMLSTLLEQHLVDYVAVDIKNSPEKYSMTTGIPTIDINPLNETICLLAASSIEYEFRTTVVDGFHNVDDFKAIGRWIEGAPFYFLQCFTDRETVPRRGLKAPDASMLQIYANTIRPYVSTVEIR